MHLFLYEIEEQITIWEGAALILNIDPTIVLERPRRIKDIPTYGIGEILVEPESDGYYLHPDKDDAPYQKVMQILIDAIELDREAFDNKFHVTDYWGDLSVCQTSRIKTEELKTWAIEKGFKSEFLGNLDTDEPKESEAKGSFNKQKQRELVFKCWLKLTNQQTDPIPMTKKEVWSELSKIDKSLFPARGTGDEDFFKNQKYVNFQHGTNKTLDSLD